MQAPPEGTGTFILGFIGLLGLLVIVAHTFSFLSKGEQKQAYTLVAVVNGIFLQMGFSPLGRVADAWIAVFPILGTGVSSSIQVLIGFGTFLNLLLGVGMLIERAGLFGLLAFLTGILSGALLLVSPILGIMAYLLGALIAEAGPSRGFVRRR